jgi:serine/threonine-protein kinase SRK2
MQSAIEPNPLAETNGRYEKVQNLGQGSFGFVQLGRSSNSELYAIKFLKRGAINKYVEAEILNHSKLRHPHVIQFKEVFLTSEYICIAMEYATGGSLFHYVQKQGRLKEAVARWFFQQLIIGADYCHKRGVANRDIKLENTLLQVVKGLPLPLLKICDFGYSKADTMSVAKSKVGTLTYMAPEVLVNRDGKYDGKVADIWSCGVMLYVMLYGRYPFDSPPGANVPKAAEILQMLDKMVGMRYTIPDGVEVSPEGRDLLQCMLLPDPASRIQLEQIMVHPWFTTNLPPEAATMNDSYLRAPFPPGHQQPDEIRQLLEGAKQQTSNKSSIPMTNVMVVPPEDDGYDASIENAIREDLLTHGKSSGNMQLQQFINAHSGNMHIS